MNIKQQALEAARPFAKSAQDLIEKASKIEAYLLGTTTLAAPPAFHPKEMIGPIVDTTTNETVELDTHKSALPNPFDPATLPDPETFIDDDGKALIALAKGLTADLSELGYAEPDMESYRERYDAKSREELAKMRMKVLSEKIEHCDITQGTPPPPIENLRAERKMENYRVPDQIARGDEYAKLRPMQLQVGGFMDKESLVVNVCRRFGTTTMIAAFARQQQASGSFNKILVLTNSHSKAMQLHELIDDAAVNVYDFNQLSSMTHTGEKYDYILIDNAASIPYAIEDKIAAYVEKCYLAVGERGHPTKVIMCSVPGQERGWFYEAFTRDDDVRKLTIDWKWSEMTAEHAAKLKSEIGTMMFGNQFENKFRPVEDS